MRLLKINVRQSSVACQKSHKSTRPPSQMPAVFHIGLLFILCEPLLVSVAANPSDPEASHLLPTNESATGKEDAPTSLRRGKVGPAFPSESKRTDRSHKEMFRLELLRQIKAIDHMKCFPKVLCGLSVDSDKSFGINKSNFVRSYLELMRNIKPPQESAAEQRLRTEDEVEEELLWPFSPRNPDRKHHSSFERISSAAMSASVELADSHEYTSRGLDSRLMGDSSSSVEKVDRMGIAVSAESKEKYSPTGSTTSSHTSITRMDTSKIPGEKKKKKNSDKSLTAKITSYFTSWLPEIVSFGKVTEDDGAESTERKLDVTKRMAKSMNDEDKIKINSNWPFSSHGFLSHLRNRLEALKMQVSSGRHGKADEAASRNAENDDHDADIYHTAVNIGKRLKDPKQCDYIYNGCPLEYNKILDMISSIRSDITLHDDTAEAVSHEFGLQEATTSTTTTTTTSTTTTTAATTTRRPQRKKTRPSTKIMHVLPNGEKVEINFRLGGSEDSEESSSQQQGLEKKNSNEDDEFLSEKDNKGEDEVVVVDLGQPSPLSTNEDISSEQTVISNRKGAPVDAVVSKNKSDKKKIGHTYIKKMSELKTGELERSGELDIEEEVEAPKPSAMASLLTAASLKKPSKSTLKLSGLTLTTDNNNEQPLEISPSYVIIKHQPLSLHTTSLLSPDSIHSPQQQINPINKLQAFQLIQNGQKIDADQITDQLKNYIRQNGGLIPKLSLHSSGLITTDDSNSFLNAQNAYLLRHQLSDTSTTSSVPKKTHELLPTPLDTNAESIAAEAASKLSSLHLSKSPFKSSLPQSPLSPYTLYAPYVHNGPEMVGSVPGRLDSLMKPKTTSTTTTSTTTTTTPTTTTENIILPGMAETLTLDTEEITDDTVDKLTHHDTVPGWITPSPFSSLENEESKESDEEKTMLENLNKTYLNDNASSSKIRYKNPKKKKPPVKANSSRVRNSSNKRNKGTKKGSNNGNGSDSEESSERVVIKHAGPYSSRPTVYQSPLKGPGPHGGAYPYLPVAGMKPNVFPGYPYWRL